MDEIALLRKVRDAVAPPSQDAVDAGRSALLERIANSASVSRGSSERVSGRRRPLISRRGVVVSSVSAAVFGGAILLLVAPPAGTAASASEVLRRAAQHASALARPGTVVEIRDRYLDSRNADGGAGAPVVAASRGLVTRVKIPQDGDPWLRKRWETSYDYAYGDRSRMPKNMAPVDPGLRGGAAFERSRLGTFAFDPLPESESMPGESPASVARLPRDPDALLEALRHDGVGADAGTGWAVLESANTVLNTGLADSALQTAIFAALQKVPDLAVVDEHATDLDGRRGVAISVRSGSAGPRSRNTSLELIIDPRSGQYLGTRAMTLRRDGVIPAGVEFEATAVYYDVVTTARDWTPPAGQQYTVYP